MPRNPRRNSWIPRFTLLEERLAPAIEPLTTVVPSRIGLTATGTSSLASVSADGQLIAFMSDAADLVPNDLNGFNDIFLYNRGTNTTELVSVNAAGTSSGNERSENPRISPDGRYVLFESSATNLVAGVPGFVRQLYARDLQTGTTILVSADNAGQAGGRNSGNGSWSADSNRVVFESDWGGFVANDIGGQMDIFVRDLEMKKTIRVSEAKDGTEAIPGAAFFGSLSFNGRFSGDGRFVAFASFAKNLGPTDSNTFSDIYVKDLQTGDVDLVTIDDAGVNQAAQNTSISSQPISQDGRFVVFATNGPNLAAGALSGTEVVFLRDRVSKTTRVISVNPSGDARRASNPVITPDGRFVTFVAVAGDLDPSVAATTDFNVYQRDLTSNQTELISINSKGTSSGNIRSGFGFYPNVFTVADPLVSADGRFVGFHSRASDLTTDGDSGDSLDLFVRDTKLNTTRRLSSGGNGDSHTPSASADLSVIGFESAASNFVPGDNNLRRDLFVRVGTENIQLASPRSSVLPPIVLNGGTLVDVTPDGRFVSFNAGGTNDYVPEIDFTGFQTASAYVRDRQTGKYTIVDLTPDGTKSGGGFNARLTPDGRYVVFGSRSPTGGSTPLVDGVTYAANFFFGSNVYYRDLVTGVTQVVDLTPDGKSTGNGFAAGQFTAISDDGRFVMFTSTSDNLLPDLTNKNNATPAIYLRDMQTKTTTLVSKNLANDGQLTGNYSSVSMTRDGRYILFASNASDLVPNDTNTAWDTFRYDRVSNTIELVSVNVAGTGPANKDSGENGISFRPLMSPDGRYIVFGSRSTDLTSTPDTNDNGDIFLRDMQTGSTTLISVDDTGKVAANGASGFASISADGKRVVFTSVASNLATPTPPPFSNLTQLYLRDLNTGTTQLITATPDGKAIGNGSIDISVSNAVDWPTISSDGKRLAFRSTATNLVSCFVDANGANDADVYLREIDAGITRLVTVNQSGLAGGGSLNTGNQSGGGTRFLFSADNDTLFFDAAAPDLIPGDRNLTFDVFAHTVAGTGTLAGTVFADTNGNGTLDMGEQGLRNLPVYLDANGNNRYDIGEPRLQTDSMGQYLFRDLGAGTYSVGSILISGLTPSSPSLKSVTLATNSSTVSGINFGAIPAVTDLVVSDILPPAKISAGRPFTVSWLVRNVGNSSITGNWQDAVYLSTDQTLDESDTLLGTVPHTGGLANFSSYSASGTFAAPRVIDGSAFVIVQTDRRRQVVGDTNRENNQATSFNSLTMSIPELSVGQAISDSFAAPLQERYFQIEVEAGQTLQLALDSAGSDGTVELYAAFERLPTAYEFDFTQRTIGVVDPRLTISLTQPGTYFILARVRAGTAATSPFTLTATPQGYGITSVGPTGAPAGPLTLEIRGTALTARTQVNLVSGSTVIAATTVDFRNATKLFATFNLGGIAIGSYDVQLTDGTNSAIRPGGFNVLPPTVTTNPLQIRLVNPAVVRAGRQGTVVLEYENISSNDIPAPLLSLSAERALLRIPGDPTFVSRTVAVLGIASDGPAGILRPGQRGSVTVDFLSDGPAGQDINFNYRIADLAATIDWASQKSTLRPSYIPVDAWNAIYANFLADVGSSVNDLQSLLGRVASYLSSIGEASSDVRRLFGFALEQADATAGGATAGIVDSRLPASGADLTFIRTYMAPIRERYMLGTFGRGWMHNWDVVAMTQSNGDVLVKDGFAIRFFTRLPNGTFVGGRGEPATLTLSAGTYRLVEPDGTNTQFRNDGRFEFREDADGNRVTASYISGRLASLTHSSGASIALNYNPQGRISQVVDSAGRTVSYSYDAAGEHLIGYTDQYGNHTYTYLTGQGLQREHALSSINFSDDTHITFEYDSRGRLTRTARDGGAVPTTYSYGTIAVQTITDAAGATTTILPGPNGRVARTIDPLGQISNFEYDHDGNLISVDFGSGIATRSAYDTRGNLTKFVDAMGHSTLFQYDARNNLTAFTDALGRTTRYRYDSGNNLIGIDYANGTTQGFTVDAEGDLVSSTNRRGQVIGYETNAAGQVTKKSFADGTSFSYAYDTRGRLSSTTDGAGKTTFTFDGRDVLTKVTYPDGKFLQYTLNNIGQRTKSIDQDGFTTNYAYDDLGRLDKLNDGSGKLIVDYNYDSVGRVSREDRGNGTATLYVFDALGQLLSITHSTPGGGLNSKFEYAYDSLGRRISSTLTDNDPNTTDGTTKYGYDALGQLTSVAFPGGRTIAYAYDQVGNRISVTDNGVTTKYTIGLNNEYTSIGDTSFVYDLDGNLISKANASGTTNYSYNSENRLVGVNGNGLSASYRYNALGQRNGQTVNGQTTNYLLDSVGLWSIAAEYDGSGAKLANYTYGIGLVSRIENGASSYYDYDAIGNVNGLTNSSGQYANRYSYLPFGETTTQSSAISNSYTFGGRFGVRTDADGTFDMRYRTYDSSSGRFLSIDPIGLASGQLNFRSYLDNAPIDSADPIGLGQFYGNGLCANPVGQFLFEHGFHHNLGHIGYVDDNGTRYDYSAWSGQSVTESAFNSKFGTKFGPQYDDASVINSLKSQAKNGTYNVFAPDKTNNCQSICYNARQSSPIKPPPTPPNFPSKSSKSGSTKAVASSDPNEITGPAGLGDVRFVAPTQSLGYTIRFENLATAGAAAQEVFITHPLDADLDPNNVELGTIGFRNMTFTVPAGLQAYQTRIGTQNLDGSPLLVDMSAVVDYAANSIRWTFRSVDPGSGELPSGVLEGILPPEDGSGRGQGFVTYTIGPRVGAVANATFDQQASIVFDTNTPIDTNVFVNTLDTVAPSSSVNALPTTIAGTSIPLSWSGKDTGSGIAQYSVFVSIDGGAFQPFLTDTTQTSANFTGEIGKSYSFFTVATDNVGLVQTIPTTGQASTTLVDPISPPPPPPSVPSPLLVGYRQTAVGSESGGLLSVLNADFTQRSAPSPFTGFTGAIRTAAADFNNDGVADIIAGTGPGISTRVVVLDGVTQKQLFAVDPFEASFIGGVYVAAGDVDGDGIPDLAITPDEGGGPRIDIYSGGQGFTRIASFFGIDDTNFRGGARASIADMTGDGTGDLIVVAGFGGGPRVAAFDGTTLSKSPQKIFGDFFAFEQTLRNGVFVTAGDLNGDGFADLIAGGGPGGGPRVLAFDGKRLLTNQYVTLANFFGGDSNSRGGIRMAIKNLDVDNRADLVVGSGAGAGSRVTAYLGKTIALVGTPPPALDFDVFPGFAGGVFVG